MSTVRGGAFAGFGVALLAGTLAAQRASPTFEVVSIKPHRPGVRGAAVMRLEPSGRFLATNVTAVDLIVKAYNLETFQLIGARGWTTVDRFDVVATAPIETQSDTASADTTSKPKVTDVGALKEKNDKRRQIGTFDRQDANQPTDLELMLRTTLAERFRLVVHTEGRQMPIYALVLARGDGKLGPSLKRSTTDCATAPTASKPSMKCGTRVDSGSFSARGVSMTDIVAAIANQVSRTVLDRTALTGNWDVDLTYTPDVSSTSTPGSKPGKSRSIDPNAPSFFTALREQLGLRLESTRGRSEVIVVDRLERPTVD